MATPSPVPTAVGVTSTSIPAPIGQDESSLQPEIFGTSIANGQDAHRPVDPTETDSIGPHILRPRRCSSCWTCFRHGIGKSLGRSDISPGILEVRRGSAGRRSGRPVPSQRRTCREQSVQATRLRICTILRALPMLGCREPFALNSKNQAA